MILLDATALVAFLAGERGAGDVESLLRQGEAAIPSVNLAESLDILVRVRRLDLDAVEAKLVPLLATVLRVVTVGEAEARRAASVRLAHYHRQRAPLSLADCLLIASASLLGAALATSDALLASIADREGVRVLKLAAEARRRKR